MIKDVIATELTVSLLDEKTELMKLESTLEKLLGLCL